MLYVYIQFPVFFSNNTHTHPIILTYSPFNSRDFSCAAQDENLWMLTKKKFERRRRKIWSIFKFKGFSALCNGEWKWTTINYLYTRFSHRSTRLIVVKLMNYCLIQEFYKYLIMRHDDSYLYKYVRDETFFFFFIFQE